VTAGSSCGLAICSTHIPRAGSAWDDSCNVPGRHNDSPPCCASGRTTVPRDGARVRAGSRSVPHTSPGLEEHWSKSSAAHSWPLSVLGRCNTSPAGWGSSRGLARCSHKFPGLVQHRNNSGAHRLGLGNPARRRTRAAGLVSRPRAPLRTRSPGWISMGTALRQKEASHATSQRASTAPRRAGARNLARRRASVAGLVPRRREPLHTSPGQIQHGSRPATFRACSRNVSGRRNRASDAQRLGLGGGRIGAHGVGRREAAGGVEWRRRARAHSWHLGRREGGRGGQRAGEPGGLRERERTLRGLRRQNDGGRGPVHVAYS